MLSNIIQAAPDYLPLSSRAFVRHFVNLLTRRSFRLAFQYEDHSMVFGYACRALFDMIIDLQSQEKELVVATTPLHHTSFRNVIEKYVKPENIHIIELETPFNAISSVPDIPHCDIVVITHLFGQDFDLSPLEPFKQKHNCLVIEDRVQGGSIDLKFSHDVVDIAMYSMAMDKRPIALGGGYMYLRKEFDDLVPQYVEYIRQLPREPAKKRLKELLKKIPTYLLYNSKTFVFLFVALLRFLKLFSNDFSIKNITKSYRKSNPGFSRGYFAYRPSKGLLKSMYENYGTHKPIEDRYCERYSKFISLVPSELQEYFFPWYKGNPSITPYNTILIEEQLVDAFLDYMNDCNISAIANPTYKLFDIKYPNEKQYTTFNNGIVYIPTVATMDKEEMIFLIERLKDFYSFAQAIKR